MEENVLNLESLPTETLTEVLVDSNINTLQSLCLSSKKISDICNDKEEYLWKEKLRREYPNLNYKDTYLMTQAIYNIFIISTKNQHYYGKYENVALIRKNKKVNVLYTGGGNIAGSYYIIPDIIFRNYNNILSNYNVNMDNLSSLTEDPNTKFYKRLEVRTTFPNDMNISTIINEGRGKLLTFNKIFDIGEYLMDIGLDVEYYPVNDEIEYDTLSIYILKNLGIVNVFEYINGTLTLT